MGDFDYYFVSPIGGIILKILILSREVLNISE